MPAGQLETKFVVLGPFPASLRQRPVKLTRGIGGMTPEQALSAELMPPVRFTWDPFSVLAELGQPSSIPFTYLFFAAQLGYDSLGL